MLGGNVSPASTVVGGVTVVVVVAGTDVISRVFGAGAASEAVHAPTRSAHPITAGTTRRIAMQRTAGHVVALHPCGWLHTT